MTPTQIHQDLVGDSEKMASCENEYVGETSTTATTKENIQVYVVYNIVTARWITRMLTDTPEQSWTEKL